VSLLGRASRMFAGGGMPEVGCTPAEVVHHENKWRLLHYLPTRGAPRHRTPVLLVPSLINRHYVLDLMPGKSFAEAMVAAGHDVYIIDWGTPAPEDRWLDFDDICDAYLGRAIRMTARRGATGRTHVLGYCLGGTLAAIHAAVRPERVASLVAIAAPVDFSDDGLLSVWSRTRSFDPGVLVEALGNVPWQLLQATFNLLRPTLPLRKAMSLVERAWDDEFLDGFFATERWGSDNVAFPGACFARYIEQLYRKNALVRGEMTLSGIPVELGRIQCPTLAVTFADDHIVPWQSAAALLEHIGSPIREHEHLSGGHVGAVVSRRAAASLWPRLSDFWRRHDDVRVSAA
jgi:polyhydroxyalkanoate synthase